MLELITSKLAGPIATGLAAILAVTLLVVWLTDKARIADVSHDRDKAVAALAVSQESVSSLKAGVTTCNAAVAQMKTESDAATAKANDAIKQAAALSARYSAHASSVLKATPGSDKCLSARQLIIEDAQ